MMRGITRAFVLLVGIAGQGSASIDVFLDKLVSTEPPPYLAIVDVMVDVSSDVGWASTGIAGVTANGAALMYAYVHDPNFGDRPIATAPGNENRFVTFFSRPSGRNTSARFDANGAVGVAGGYLTQRVRLEPNLLNIAVYDPTGPQPPRGVDGYIARIVLDLRQVAFDVLRTDSSRIVATFDRPRNSVVLFESRPPGGFDGMFVAAVGLPYESYSFDWGIYGFIGGQSQCGDLNGDGVVSIRDLTVLLAHFGVTSGATPDEGELDGDGAVSLGDLIILLSHFGEGCP